MRATRILLSALCAVTLGACAGKRPPPPQRYALGGTQVEYRDYSRVQGSLCDAEPRKLADELGKINTLLEQFVTTTEASARPDATAEQLEFLRKASRTLGPVVEAHSKNLAGLRACDFQREAPFPELIRKGQEVTGTAKTRLVQAPMVLAAADLRVAEEKWKVESTTREATAKQTWCKPGAAVGTGELYYARQEADGSIQWLFCDGLSVEASSGGEPRLSIPDSINKKDRRRIQAQRYLEAAKSYHPEEIDRFVAEKKATAEE